MATTQTPSQPKKVVTMLKNPAAATAAAAPAKPAKAAKTPANGEGDAPQGSRYKGATTGMRVQQFQNHTLEQNFKKKLTDEELAAQWREEFPMAVAFDARIVRLVRQAWNRGAHKNEAPETPLAEYDENRKPLPIRTRGRQAAADTDTPAASPAKAAAKPTAVPSKKK